MSFVKRKSLNNIQLSSDEIPLMLSVATPCGIYRLVFAPEILWWPALCHCGSDWVVEAWSLPCTIFFFVVMNPFGLRNLQKSSSDKGGKPSSLAVHVVAWLPCGPAVPSWQSLPSVRSKMVPSLLLRTLGDMGVPSTPSSCFAWVSASRHALDGVRFTMGVGTVTNFAEIRTVSLCWFSGRGAADLQVITVSVVPGSSWALSSFSFPWTAASTSCAHICLSFRRNVASCAVLQGEFSNMCSVPPYR